MTVYTSVFGGSTIMPTDVSLRSLAISANTTLVWPTEAASGANVVADIMRITATGTPNVLMPDATGAGPGTGALFVNAGSATFTVTDAAGGVIVSVASGQAYQVYLYDNSTTAGLWLALQYGGGGGGGTAASLAGPGLKAIGATLGQKLTVTAFNSAYTLGVGDRAVIYNWTGGTGTAGLTAPATLGSDWFADIKNSGSGVLTVTPASGTIDGVASLTMQPQDSFTVLTDGTNFYTLGRGQSVTSTTTYLAINVAGTGDYTLSAAEQGKSVYKFTGLLTGARNIIVPSTIASYTITNATTGAFALTVKTAAGTGYAVAAASSSIVYCDGTNVTHSESSGISTPISVANGGTGSTTAGGALINLGGTTDGIAVFTAASPTAIRTGIGAVSADEATMRALVMS